MQYPVNGYQSEQYVLVNFIVIGGHFVLHAFEKLDLVLGDQSDLAELLVRVLGADGHLLGIRASGASPHDHRLKK